VDDLSQQIRTTGMHAPSGAGPIEIIAPSRMSTKISTPSNTVTSRSIQMCMPGSLAAVS
jgi:hypothetical protein